MSLDRDDSAGRRRDDKAGKAKSPTQQGAPIDYICVDERHLQVGRDVADGGGHITVHKRRWAYCSAGLADESHDWRPSGGLDFAAMRHVDLERFRKV
jgi:hypothetical protein